MSIKCRGWLEGNGVVEDLTRTSCTGSHGGVNVLEEKLPRGHVTFFVFAAIFYSNTIGDITIGIFPKEQGATGIEARIEVKRT